MEKQGGVYAVDWLQHHYFVIDDCPVPRYLYNGRLGNNVALQKNEISGEKKCIICK